MTTEMAAAQTFKRVKKNPPPLLPPEEEVVSAPSPKLDFKDRMKKLVKDKVERIPIKSPFATPEISADIVNEQLEVGRADRALKRLTYQAIAIAALGCILAVGAPFFSPIYVYNSRTPEGRTAFMMPLDLPNLTNPAVVSWAAISTTEILSFGFGDFEEKALLQKKRFTKLGWDAFVKAFLGGKISDAFKKGQMVMTTVPTDTPVIISQGVNEEGVYHWKLQVPIITTFAANNNVIKPEPGVIEMTIVRVSSDENPAGLAIDIWKQIRH
jgi:hypothetical protein